MHLRSRWWCRNVAPASRGVHVAEVPAVSGTSDVEGWIMNSSNTRRAHCVECDPDGRKSKSLAITIDERGSVEFCHRCGYKSANNGSSSASFTVQRSADVSGAK